MPVSAAYMAHRKGLGGTLSSPEPVAGRQCLPSLKEAVLTHGTHLVRARKGVKGHGGGGIGKSVHIRSPAPTSHPFSNKDDPHAPAIVVLGLG